MSVDKPTCKELAKRMAELDRKNNLAIAGQGVKKSGRLHNLELIIQERTAELTDTISTLHEEVLQRIEAEKSLRSMAVRLTMAEHKERHQLAQLLHDDLQQLLVAAIFQIGNLYRSSEKETQRIASEVEDLLQKSISLTRTLTSELSPPVLHGSRLLPAFAWLSRWMRDKHGLRVEVSGTDQIPIENREIRGLLFESVRELLFNVVKHAKTDTAHIVLNRTDDHIEIQVCDQGCGFDVPAVFGEEISSVSLGLFSIRERLILLGGSLSIESSPGQGSKFTLLVPNSAAGT